MWGRRGIVSKTNTAWSYFFVAGMLHSGCSVSSLTNWLASVNIPAPSENMWKRREREIGPTLEAVAEESCDKALQEEIHLTALSVGMSELDYIELVAGYDMGWQRRGTGRGANSLSGHGSLIGYHSKKLLAYGARKMACRTCEVADREGKSAESHDCRRNWSGSSKGMEPSVGVELLKKTRSNKAGVSTLVMDDDASTIAHVHREYDEKTVKWSDTNHSKKCLSNALYKLQPKYKKTLTNRVINYLKKNYAYALRQNKDDEEGLAAALNSIVPHVFDDHSQCGSWCGYVKDPINYKHKTLPWGKGLTGDDLKKDLERLFSIHAHNAARLAPLGSTMSNESWNNTVASKAPKNKHYSSSESLDFRLGAAACQKNIGPNYLSEVFQKTEMSPSTALGKHSNKLKRKFAMRKDRAETKQFKRRRLELGETRMSRLRSLELREGQSYLPGVGINEESLDIEEIPPKTVPPVCEPLPNEKYTFLYFDLETTDREVDASICQISVVGPDDSCYDTYTLPEKPISRGASIVNHLKLHDTVMTYNDEPVATVPIKSGLEGLLAYVKQFPNAVLVGHNVKNFDTLHLFRHILKYDLKDSFTDAFVGFCDTLPLFRQLFPKHKSHTQESLVGDILGSPYLAHNAVEDCRALKEFVSKTDALPSLLSVSYSAQWAWQYLHYTVEKKRHKETFQPAILAKAITENCANNCASSGLCLKHLKLAYERNGDVGLRDLFTEKDANNKARVMARPENAIQKLVKYFG